MAAAFILCMVLAEGTIRLFDRDLDREWMDDRERDYYAWRGNNVELGNLILHALVKFCHDFLSVTFGKFRVRRRSGRLVPVDVAKDSSGCEQEIDNGRS